MLTIPLWLVLASMAAAIVAACIAIDRAARLAVARRALSLRDVCAREEGRAGEAEGVLAERDHGPSESEARFRQLADAMPQIVWTARPHGYFDYYNERWYEFTGFARDRFGDESWQPILHPDDLSRCRESWHAAVTSREPFNIEYRFWDRRELRWRWFVGRALPVRDDHGRIIKWFGTCTDIDDQKRVEDELRSANYDLEQFAFSASHDLQEPLRSVKIYSELLIRRYGDRLDGQAREFVGYMRSGATRMETLVRDLLAYTEVNRLERPAEAVDLNKALQTALANLAPAVQETGAQIEIQTLPSVRLHETHAVQLFQNLISNAIKYRSPQGQPLLRITAERQKDYCIVSVCDNGIGIEPEYKERIFGVFKRLHRNYSGTGIGLAICQRVVARYGGRIWVESSPGKGATFFLTVPERAPRAHSAAAESSAG